MSKPTLNLGDIDGSEGNAYVILGRAKKTSDEYGLNFEEINKDATSSDYNHLLDVIEEHFEVVATGGRYDNY